MACNKSANCKHYNAWWCDKHSGCDDYEQKTAKPEKVSEPVITETKQTKRKKAEK